MLGMRLHRMRGVTTALFWCSAVSHTSTRPRYHAARLLNNLVFRGVRNE